MSASTPKPAANLRRVDRWLWAVRVFKTRSLAVSACRRGRVEVDAVACKPARILKPGETVVVREAGLQRVLVVRDFPVSRVGAKLVPEFCADKSPPRPSREERIAAGELVLARPRGMGRPTKRDRRLLDDLLGAS